jgi:hypothetical protein
MAWVTPKTYVASDILTAADFNQDVRDNMLETETAKATKAGGLFMQSTSSPNRFEVQVPAVEKVSLPHIEYETDEFATPIYDDPTLEVPAATSYLIFFAANQRVVSGGPAVWFSVSIDGEEPSLRQRMYSTTTGIIRQSGWFKASKVYTPGTETRTIQFVYGADANTLGHWTQRDLTVIPIA